VVVCLERGADLYMAQLMSLPLTVSCFSKIQIGLTFLVPAHLGSPGQRAVKRVCVCLRHKLSLAPSMNVNIVISPFLKGLEYYELCVFRLRRCMMGVKGALVCTESLG